jgi:FMN reductase (NADPH)
MASDPFDGDNLMPNPTLELIHHHASVRQYKPDPVPVAIVNTIVAAAQHASTSSALQAYSIVAVTEAARRDKLAELCGNQDHIRQAPVFLTWCADLSRLEHICTIRGYSITAEYTENFLVAAFDAILASQNAALAAESLGLGICYIGSIRRNPQEVIDLLGLPRLVFPVVGMTVGWPSQDNQLRPRLPLELVLHWEQYDTTPRDELLRVYDQVMISTGIYEDRKVPIPGRKAEIESVGWLEQSARRVSKADRTGLRNAIKMQGFALK